MSSARPWRRCSRASTTGCPRFLEPSQRPRLGPVDRPADGLRPAAAVPAVRQADQVAAAHAGAGAADQGAPEQHKGDRETLNVEMMKLYKDNNANPISGCLPLLLQLPVFFALFSVIREFKPQANGEPAARGSGSRPRTSPRAAGPRSSARRSRRRSPAPPTSSHRLGGDARHGQGRRRRHAGDDGRHDLLDAEADDGPRHHDRPARSRSVQKIMLYVLPLQLRDLRLQLPDRRAPLLADDQPLVMGQQRVRDRADAAADAGAARPPAPKGVAGTPTAPRPPAPAPPRLDGRRAAPAPARAPPATPAPAPRGQRGARRPRRAAGQPQEARAGRADGTEPVPTAPAPDARPHDPALYRPKDTRDRDTQDPDQPSADARRRRPRRASRTCSCRRATSPATTSSACSTSPTSTATSTWTSRTTAPSSRSSATASTPWSAPSGAVLDALQELTRLAVVQQTGVRSRLMLDIGGWRARRKTELTETGVRAAERVPRAAASRCRWRR